MNPIYFFSLGVFSLAITACGSSSGSSDSIQENASGDASAAVSSSSNINTSSSVLSSAAASEMSAMSSSSLAASSEANPEDESSSSSQAISSASNILVFGVEKSFPAKKQLYILPESVLSVTFNEDIDSGSIDSNNAIVVVERETQVAVAGELSIADARTLMFTPTEPLKENLVYNITISGDILAQDGDSYIGESWDFSTPPNLGATTQEQIAQCGNTSTVEGLAYVVRERMLLDGSVCKALGFTMPAEGYTTRLNCALVDVADTAASIKVNSLKASILRGNNGYDVSFNVGAALRARGYSENFRNITEPQLNTGETYGDYFTQLERDECEVFMDPKFSEFGSHLLRQKGFPASITSFTFYEFILGEAEP